MSFSTVRVEGVPGTRMPLLGTSMARWSELRVSRHHSTTCAAGQGRAATGQGTIRRHQHHARAWKTATNPSVPSDFSNPMHFGVGVVFVL